MECVALGRTQSRQSCVSVGDDQTHHGRLRTSALSLIEQQPSMHEPGVTEWLNRLCRAVAQQTTVHAVTVTVGSPGHTSAVLGADKPASNQFAEAEYALGEGPSHDAWRFRRPVLVPELGGHYDGAWPGYITTAIASGVLAAFAFPLQVGAVRVGVLTLYHVEAGPLAHADLTTCLVMAELATERLIDPAHAGEGQFEPSLDDAVAFRSEIYQAQGMVAVALGITLADGLASMRGHAFQADRELIDVAYDIVHNGFQLTHDRNGENQEPDLDEKKDQP